MCWHICSSMSRLLSWLPEMLSKMFCSRCDLPPSSSRLEEILLFRFMLNDRTTHAFSVRYWNRIMLGCNHQLLYILAHWIFVDPGIFDLLRILRAWFIGTKCTPKTKNLAFIFHWSPNVFHGDLIRYEVKKYLKYIHRVCGEVSNSVLLCLPPIR